MAEGPEHSSTALRTNERTGVRAPTELTDVHRTKIPADDPRLHIDRPRSRVLKKGPVLAVVAAVTLLSTVAIAVGFSSASSSTVSDKPSQQPAPAGPTVVALPDVLKDPPEPGVPAPTSPSAAAAPDHAQVVQPAPVAFAPGEVAPQQNGEELSRALGSGVFPQMDDGAPYEGGRSLPASQTASIPPSALSGGGLLTAPSVETCRAADPNLQERKNDFLARAGASSGEYLPKDVTRPRSPYEVKAGTVIPTVLVSGINSDLPGQVIGQVRENVYDSVTGNHLLIPQGSRILAAYDSMVAWGQERVLVCWNRLIRPDGSSLALECMPGVDVTGYSGFSDQVDHHWWRIINGAAFSSLLAATAQRSQGDITGFQPTFPQLWANNAAGQINQAGQQLTQKNLQIQPTITVRPGFSVNVLVSKDIVLPPYQQGVPP